LIKENPKTTLLVAYLTAFLGQACELGFAILVFRQFSVEEVGTYALIMAIVAFAGFALDMGINQTLIRGFSQKTLDFPQAVVGSVLIRLPVLLVGLIVMVCWLKATSITVTALWQPLSVAILWQVVMSFRAIATSWLRSHDKQKTANVLNFLLPFGRLWLGLTLVYLQIFSLLYFFISILLVEILISTLSFLSTSKIHFSRNIGKYLTPSHIKQSLNSLWKPSLVFTGIGLCVVVNNRLDWMLIYAYVSKTELAYYAFANKTFEIFNSFFAILIYTSFPWMCKLIPSGRNEEEMGFAFRSIIFIGLFVAGMSIICLPSAITFIFGSKYNSTYLLIKIFMFTASIGIIGSLFYYILITIQYEKVLLVASLLGSIIQVITNLLLIPIYGALGAAISMLITHIVVLNAFLLVIYKQKLWIPLFVNRVLIGFLLSNILLMLIVKFKLSTVHSSILIIAYIIAMVFIALFAFLITDERRAFWALFINLSKIRGV